MLKIKNYVKVKSVAEAYELNQKKTACILGGMVWLKMGNRNISTAIDLSGLGMDVIQERDEEFVIGCMTTLRDLETDPRLDAYTHGAMKESLRHIVGVQFRNCATVGGSIYGRYGFSDVLTMFLALDTEVELYHAGRVPLTEFVHMKKDRDVLMNIIVKKTPLFCAYISQRNTETDFPVLACCVSLLGDEARTVIGARPGRAMIAEDKKQILAGFKEMTNKQRAAAVEAFAEYAAETVPVGKNMRASAEYRSILVKVLVKRAWEAVGGMKNEY
ncbi:MAG: FAD binding domain-containing protein [Eubacteriales bacterium]|nr:FAD binding domain-containing protein [Eubacteriales bacterium]